MTRDEFLQLGAEYAAGCLQGKELRDFESYLRTATTEEARDLAELVNTVSLLPLALDRKTPSESVKEQLLKQTRLSVRVRESGEQRTQEVVSKAFPPRPSGWRVWMPFGVTFAGVAMVIGFAVYVAGLLNTIESQNQRLVELQDQLQRKEELLGVLSAKQVDMVLMSGLPSNPASYGKIIWDREKRIAILQVSNLPPVPSDKDYQLWVIKSVGGGQPISAGVFAVGSAEPFYFKIEQLAVTDPREIAAFAITLEPKGGVPAPTGAMYVAGSPKL